MPVYISLVLRRRVALLLTHIKTPEYQEAGCNLIHSYIVLADMKRMYVMCDLSYSGAL
jgi:hypothetical protein